MVSYNCENQRSFFYVASCALNIAILAIAILGSKAVQASPAGVDLLPHNAVYRLGLNTSQEGAINSMKGRIVYDWTSDCKGWIVKSDLDMDIAYSNGKSIQMATRFSTWEAQDGSKFRFAVHQGDNVSGPSSFIGRAIRNEADNMVTVDITGSDHKTSVLNGVLFPTDFLVEIISEAKKGTQSINYPVFDGTTELEAFNVSAVMLPLEAKSDFPEMEGLAAWRVFLAYYDQKDGSTLPVQEQSLLLYENGVVTDIELDFGDFTVAGNLIEFESRKLPVCK
ncbi:EipB family protein [Kiloniella antarctica]|uniref:EipB family protein n=1 Tax=Kiloniella antarctica TaxID=1550907 RepID=A0ABW5BSA1_9PROT